MRVTRHDNGRAWGGQEGRDMPNLEMRESESFPLSAYPFKLSFARQPLSARKASTIRLQRISTEA